MCCCGSFAVGVANRRNAELLPRTLEEGSKFKRKKEDKQLQSCNTILQAKGILRSRRGRRQVNAGKFAK
jgi:hypothetical protein